MLFVQVNPRRQRNMLLSRGGLLQRNRRGQVWRGGRRDRCQGVLQQGLQRLRRVHQLRQQCRRRQRDGRLLQWLWQVSDHNGKKAIAAANALHSFKLFQICKKSTVAFLDAKIGGASKVKKVFTRTNEIWRIFCTSPLISNSIIYYYLSNVKPFQVRSPLWKTTTLPYTSKATLDNWPNFEAVSVFGQFWTVFRPASFTLLSSPNI